MKREHLLEKGISALLVIPAIYFSTPEQFRELFIIFGQGHFLSTYLYQYKAGKINFNYALFYLLVLPVLFGVFWWYPDSIALETFTGIYFIAHFLFDEEHLLGEKPTSLKGLEILPIFLMIAGNILDYHYKLGIAPLLTAVSLTIIIVNYILMKKQRVNYNVSNLYFLLGAIVLAYMNILKVQIHVIYIFGATVLYHYSNWYLNIYFKYNSLPEKRREYLRNIIGINLVTIAAYAHYQALGISGKESILRYFFATDYFYLWTILHLMFTTRAKDFWFWCPPLARKMEFRFDRTKQK